MSPSVVIVLEAIDSGKIKWAGNDLVKPETVQRAEFFSHAIRGLWTWTYPSPLVATAALTPAGRAELNAHRKEARA